MIFHYPAFYSHTLIILYDEAVVRTVALAGFVIIIFRESEFYINDTS